MSDVVHGVAGGVEHPEAHAPEQRVRLLGADDVIHQTGDLAHLRVVCHLSGGEHKEVAFHGGQRAADLRLAQRESHRAVVALGEIAGVAEVVKVGVGAQQTDGRQAVLLQRVHDVLPQGAGPGVQQDAVGAVRPIERDELMTVKAPGIADDLSQFQNASPQKLLEITFYCSMIFRTGQADRPYSGRSVQSRRYVSPPPARR